MLLNFYYAKKSTVEASEKFAETLVKVFTQAGTRLLIKSAGKYSCTIFVPGATSIQSRLHYSPIANTIAQMLSGKFTSIYDTGDNFSFIGVDHSTGAVESLAKSYHDRGKSLFESLD